MTIAHVRLNMKNLTFVFTAKSRCSPQEKADASCLLLKDPSSFMKRNLKNKRMRTILSFLRIFFCLRRNDYISTVREAAKIAIEQIGGDDAEQALHVTRVLGEEIEKLRKA